jgi:hypothetical protein
VVHLPPVTHPPSLSRPESTSLLQGCQVPHTPHPTLPRNTPRRPQQPTCTSSPTVSTRFLQGCQMTSSENSEVTRYLYSMFSLQAGGQEFRQTGRRRSEVGWVGDCRRAPAGAAAGGRLGESAFLHGGTPPCCPLYLPLLRCGAALSANHCMRCTHAPDGQLRLAGPHTALGPLELHRLLPPGEGAHHADGLPKVRLEQVARGGGGQGGRGMRAAVRESQRARAVRRRAPAGATPRARQDCR